MANNDYEKIIYDLKEWQSNHVKQLAYTRNLILVLSTASLGFAITLLLNERVADCQNLVGLKVSIFGFLLSITIATLIALLESENYRLKYKIARNIERDKEFKSLEKTCTSLEKTNRVLFYLQLAFFVVAIILLTIILI